LEKRVLAQLGGQRIERAVQLMSSDRLRSPVVGKCVQGFTREVQAIFDAGK